MKKSNESLKNALERKDPDAIMSRLGFFNHFKFLSYAFYGEKRTPEILQELETDYRVYSELDRMCGMIEISSEERKRAKQQKEEVCLKILEKYKDCINISKYVESAFILIEGIKDKIGKNEYSADVVNMVSKRDSVLRAMNVFNIVPLTSVKFSSEDKKLKIVGTVGEGYLKILSKRRRRLEKLPVDFPIDFLVDNLTLDDIAFIADNDAVYTNLATLTGISEDFDYSNNRSLSDNEKEIFKRNLEFIDLDSLILAAYRNYLKTLFKSPNYDTLSNFTKLYERVYPLIENKGLGFSGINGEVIASFQSIANSINEFRSHFIQNVYIDDTSEIKRIRADILDGISTYRVLSMQDYKDNSMMYTEANLVRIASFDMNAVKDFSKNGIVDLDTLKNGALRFYIDILPTLPEEELKSFRKPSKDTIEYLMSNDVNLVSEDDFVKLYAFELVTDRVMGELVSDGNIDLTSVFSMERLVKYYENAQSIDDEKLLSKVIEGYKKYNLDIKTSEERLKKDAEFIDVAIDSGLEEDDLIELYQRGVICLESLADIASTYGIERLFVAGKLKYKDIRNLYDSGTINDDMIRNILSSKDIDDGQKIMLIASTFRRPEDEEKRTEFRLYLARIEKVSNNGFEPIELDGTGDKSSGDSRGEIYERHITDPFTRCMLISAIDPNYRYEYLKDGHVIFEFPEHNKYVIEKLFMAGDDKKFARDAATYILDGDFYRTNESAIKVPDKDSLEVCGGIERKALTHLRREDEKRVKGNIGQNFETQGLRIDRLQHIRNWAKNFCKYFGLTPESEYSEEKKAEIESLINTVEKSWRIVGHDE